MVSLHNLERVAVFDEEDVGEYKAVAFASKAAKINSSVRVIPFVGFLRI